MVDYLKNLVHLTQTKNKAVYISNMCPFSKCFSKKGRIFRLNTKLKVAKCFKCGISVKELTSLKLAVQHPIKFKIRNLKTDYILNNIYNGHILRDALIKELLKEKVSTNITTIEKGGTGNNLPF